MKQTLSIIILVLLFSTSCSFRFDTEFDSEAWKNWVETESTMSLRWDMRKDLIKKHKLVGMSKDEIIDLLGEPDHWLTSDYSYYYYLGMARFGIDTGSLKLTFENGIVVKYKFWHG